MLGIDFGVGLRSRRTGGGRAEPVPPALALAARMNVPPSTERLEQIERLYTALGPLLDKLDALYVFAAHDAQAARLNWVAGRYDLTAVNSPDFIADRGYAGNGSSSYLSTGFVPAAASAGGARMSLTSSLLALGSLSAAGPDASAQMGCRDGDNLLQLNAFVPNGERSEFLGYLNVPSASAGRLTVETRKGRSYATRNGRYWRVDRDAVTTLSGSVSSTGELVSGAPVVFGGRMHANNGFSLPSSDRLWFGAMGGHLTEAEVVQLDAALVAYGTAVGALP